MKTLKEELQDIVDKDKLNTTDFEQFICLNLTLENQISFAEHKAMASNYAKKFFCGKTAWWESYQGEHFTFVISEKYRFIKDLIAIL